MFTAGNEGDGLAAKEKVVRILRRQADGIGVEGLQQESKQQNQASEHSDSSGAPGEQLACRGFSRGTGDLPAGSHRRPRGAAAISVA